MKKKIMICDDDADILELCSHILSREYEVVTFESVEDIEALVANYSPDLILMDLWIPEIGGEEAAKLLKKNPDSSEIPILLFSANEELPVIAEKVKADGYIKKPFILKDFKRTISENLSVS